MSKTAQKSNKYKVVPNLSLRGPEIMRRLKNRSLQLDAAGQYSLDESIEASRRLDKVGLKLAQKENQKKIDELSKKLDKK